MTNLDLRRMRAAMSMCGPDYVLRQLAEEYVEVAQAALKLIRALYDETPTCVSEAMAEFVEEISDADVMRDIYFATTDPADIPGYSENREYKYARAAARLARKGLWDEEQ